MEPRQAVARAYRYYHRYREWEEGAVPRKAGPSPPGTSGGRPQPWNGRQVSYRLGRFWDNDTGHSFFQSLPVWMAGAGGLVSPGVAGH